MGNECSKVEEQTNDKYFQGFLFSTCGWDVAGSEAGRRESVPSATRPQQVPTDRDVLRNLVSVICIFRRLFKASNEMDAYTSSLGLLTYLPTDWLICPHNSLDSHLKLVPGSRACFCILRIRGVIFIWLSTIISMRMNTTLWIWLITFLFNGHNGSESPPPPGPRPSQVIKVKHGVI